MKIIRRLIRIVVLVCVGDRSKKNFWCIEIELPKWKKGRERKKEERRKVLSLYLDWTNGGSSGIKNSVRIEIERVKQTH